ncbi:hypothetical protein AX16_009160 [Volvariella volvacea WC 439]|nr:hypothetical protein AX16_009160 [Volvariella volvacea WC 439]
MLNQVLLVINFQLTSPSPPQSTTTTPPSTSFQIKIEKWEKKLNQILQRSTPPSFPPAPVFALTQTQSLPKISTLAPFNKTPKDVSSTINHIHQYAVILIGQYPDMHLGDLVHRVLIFLQHSSTI